ncbi:4831_t:CDS:1, partial [Racocetra persica]
ENLDSGKTAAKKSDRKKHKSKPRKYLPTEPPIQNSPGTFKNSP